MAVVDSLLSLIVMQGADALLIPPGEPPSLEKNGERKRLSMPYPGDEIVAAILAEVTTAAERDRIAKQQLVETRYTAGGGEPYLVRVEPRASGVRLVFRRPGTEGAEEPAANAVVAPGIGAGVAVVPSVAPRFADDSVAVAAPPSSAAPVVHAQGLDLDPAVACDPGPFRDVLMRAQAERASDILLSVGKPPHLRLGGSIAQVSAAPVTTEDLLAFMDPALSPRARYELESRGSADVAVLVHDGSVMLRYRANLFRQHHGLALALRPIGRQAPSLRELNLPDELAQLTGHRSGLVLMTGTTGSGKSTTLVALIEQINRTSPKHVITLEDPIEYEYVQQRALIHQRQVGTHVDAFATGLRAALRESPDVILVGEMRDHETISAALTAAETGHLVLSTLHAGGAAMAVDRIIDVFPEYQQLQVRMQLASVLRAVVTQELVPSQRPPNRAPAIELLAVNTAVATKIREGRGHQLQSEIQKGRADGMIPLESSLASLVRRGLTDVKTAIDHSREPALFQQFLQRG